MQRSKESIYNQLLALKCRRGDSKAFEELISLWERRLLYFIRRLVRDEQDAWDILQETWIKVMHEIGRLRNPEHLTTWLYRVARNTAVSHLRREIPRRDLTVSTEHDTIASETTETFAFEDADQVHRGLDLLSLPHREVLTLHFLEDMLIDEIAMIIHVPAGTVKSRLFYAKRALRYILEQGDDHHE
ncbi:RNA polymerase sigma factor [Candidatus Latescibacterota bacterium]